MGIVQRVNVVDLMILAIPSRAIVRPAWELPLQTRNLGLMTRQVHHFVPVLLHSLYADFTPIRYRILLESCQDFHLKLSINIGIKSGLGIVGFWESESRNCMIRNGRDRTW